MKRAFFYGVYFIYINKVRVQGKRYLLQKFLNLLFDVGDLFRWFEAGYHLTFLVDEEFGEIPFDVRLQELLLKYTRSSHNSTQSNTNPVFKWAQDLNRYLSKDDVHMTKQTWKGAQHPPVLRGAHARASEMSLHVLQTLDS